VSQRPRATNGDPTRQIRPDDGANSLDHLRIGRAGRKKSADHLLIDRVAERHIARSPADRPSCKPPYRPITC
jgi:hypothetical protein